jgi:ParB-like chromosome segregation protein Spo0J
MRVNPLAEIFPLMTGVDLQNLAADIKANGQRHPIVLHKGAIVDGRNRLAACRLARVEPQFVEYDGPEDKLLAFVVSENLNRRQLTPSQQALCAADAAARQGISSKAAATVMGLDVRHVQYARVVVEKGTPELQEAVRNGIVSVFDGHKLALHRGLSKQRRLVAEGPAACHDEAKKIVHRSAEREEARAPVAAPAPAVRKPAPTTIWHELLKLDRATLEAERDRLPTMKRLLDRMIQRVPHKGTAAAYIDLKEFDAMLREARDGR